MTVTELTDTAPAPVRIAANSWSVDVDERWRSFGGAQGGLVIGAMADVAAESTGRRPAGITAHLHAPLAPGVAELRVAENRSGRSGSSVAVTLLQSGRRLATAQALTVVTLGESTTWAPDDPTPGLPDPHDVERFRLPVQFVPFGQFLDIRPLNDARPGGAGADPEYVAWIRLLADVDSGIAATAILLDALPPSLFALWSTPVPLPTVEMTMHFGPHDWEPGWALVRQHTVWATEDLAVDDATVHAVDGRLLGQSRQIRRLLR